MTKDAETPTPTSGTAPEVSPALVLPVLPLRDIVVFPHMIVPLLVGRDKSIQALETAAQAGGQIFLVAQRDSGDDYPTAQRLYSMGAVGQILQLLRLPDQTVKVLVEGKARARVKEYRDKDGLLVADVESIEEEDHEKDPNVQTLMRAVIAQFEQFLKLNKRIPSEVITTIRQIEHPGKLADTLAHHLSMQLEEKQKLLELHSLTDRLERVFGQVEGEISVLQVEKRIRSRVKRQLEKTQREYYLNEQIKAIQKELGDGDEGREDLAEFEKKLVEIKLPKMAKERATSEIRKLKAMSPMSAEATVVRNYLDWIFSLPWKKRSRVKRNLVQAEDILNADHYGLEKVKERILEYLAVLSRRRAIRGPILCLVGPPGVGKTSLGRSIAKATGRSFVRMSLGGVRDEAEIRGHRRTYIGAMPGRIIQGMKKAKTSNPVFLLDEIDKLGTDWRGDPASALLEVLDPEQNLTFSDHFLEIEYDLSDVMFVTTANTLNLQRPLLDRMEVVRIAGYTEAEKVEIAKRHLVDRQREENGLKPEEFSISDEGLRKVIQQYTREAGVRSLERELAKLARRSVRAIMAGKCKSVEVTPENLKDYAGVPKFTRLELEAEDAVGLVTGLAWTEVGGEILTIESVATPGRGRTTMTGKLGDVMQESISAAQNYVRSKAPMFGLDPSILQRIDLHVHVPEGATPKDGPSAGVAMATSIVSTLTGIPVRRDVAMTGEITLRGRVLPIGGLKEKLIAAARAGSKTVIIPLENKKDLDEVPEAIKRMFKIATVSTIDEVLALALASELTPIEWDLSTPVFKHLAKHDEANRLTAH